MRKRILVADDDQAILDVLRLILEDGGYEVAAVSGEQGLLATLEPPPDLILLDVRLSGVDGRDLCRRLKRSAATQSIPIVMISASAAMDGPGDDCGADAFVAKPFDIDDVLNCVGCLIKQAAPLAGEPDRWLPAARTRIEQ